MNSIFTTTSGKLEDGWACLYQDRATNLCAIDLMNSMSSCFVPLELVSDGAVSLSKNESISFSIDRSIARSYWSIEYRSKFMC